MSAFGSTQNVAETYAACAASIKSLDTSKIDAPIHDDVLTMIEFMRQQLIAEDQRLTALGKELSNKLTQLGARERELAIKLRAATLVQEFKPARHRWFK